MSILGNLFTNFFESSALDADPPTINPVSGLPMVAGPASVDVAGNPYGMGAPESSLHDWEDCNPGWNSPSDSVSSSWDHDWP